MLYSFKLSTDPAETWTWITARDGDREFRLIMGKNQEQHWYLNLPVSQRPTIDCPINFELTELSYGESEYMTKAQLASNNLLTHEGNASFRTTIKGDPKRAIIMLPAYKGDRGWENPYGVLPVENFGLDDTLYMSFQDPFFVNGSYFLSDNYGKDPVPDTISAIRRRLNEHGLPDSSVTLVGSSKGANIAAIISQHFEGNQLIVSGYATDIAHWVSCTGQASLTPALAYYGIKYPDALKILQVEANRKETHWFYSIGDDNANRGNESLSAPQLSTYAREASHGTLFRSVWDEITNLISARPV